MTDDVTLLRGFVERRSEQDFARLVARHVGLVFGTAVRRVGGDAHLAEDVTQAVFVDLARKARALQHHRVLAGWLYTSTIYAAAKAVRAEQRRRHREQQAYAMQDLPADTLAPDPDWAQVQPVLDDALHALPPRDRDAILLRFFHAHGFAAIGIALNLSENAARMRVDRALEKLRGQLARRGITSTLAALGATLSAHAAGGAVSAALTTTITSAALAGASTTGATVTLLNFLAMTKTQFALAAAVVATGVGTLAHQQHERNLLEDLTTREVAIANDIGQRHDELARLKQTESDFTALRARVSELPSLRREIRELRERRAHLEVPLPPAASRPASRGPQAASDPADSPANQPNQPPRPTHRVPPKYPLLMQELNMPGEVVVSFVVDVAGQVQDPIVVETTHPDFAAPTLDAIRQWQFSAGAQGGRPVNARIKQTFLYQFQHLNWF